ncbi:hypothetical protein M673_00205 [Aureimonas sp. AU20]|nr:hypothetical protein M673_00205 [Aureimonas sp. AU20]
MSWMDSGMASRKWSTPLYVMAFSCLLALSGALWDGLHDGDWAWRHWVTPIGLLVSFAIMCRQTAR